MKDIKDTITESMIVEESQARFQVAFNDFVDDEGIPIPVTILVNREAKELFEKFVIDQEANIFAHACSSNNEYY